MPQLADDMDFDPLDPRFLQPKDIWEVQQKIKSSKPCYPSAEWMPMHGKTMSPHVRMLLLELLHRSRSRFLASKRQAPCLMQPLRGDRGCNVSLARVNNQRRTLCFNPPTNMGHPAVNSVTTAVNDLSAGPDSRHSNFWKDCDIGFIRAAYRRALRGTSQQFSPPSTPARPDPFSACHHKSDRASTRRADGGIARYVNPVFTHFSKPAFRRTTDAATCRRHGL